MREVQHKVLFTLYKSSLKFTCQTLSFFIYRSLLKYQHLNYSALSQQEYNNCHIASNYT